MARVQLLIAHALAAVAMAATIPACTTIVVQSPQDESTTADVEDADTDQESSGEVDGVDRDASTETSTVDAPDMTGSTTGTDWEPAHSSTNSDTSSTGVGEEDGTATGGDSGTTGSNPGPDSDSDTSSTGDSTTSAGDEPCGNGAIDDGEDCDTAADPYDGVGCSEDCRFDFAQVPQLFCAGTCSWAGPSNCDQADADVFCRLRTGDPDAFATSFTLGAPSDDAGFPCSNPEIDIELDGADPRVLIGELPGFGVDIPVYYQAAKVAEAHGGGATAAIIDVTCS